MAYADRLASAIFRLPLLLMALALFAASPASRADAPAPDEATRTFEFRFMHEMVEHHMMAVQMGMTCPGKAVHQELRAMCQNVVTTQQQEIAAMEQWLSAWYRVTRQAHDMPPGHQARMEKLALLSNAEFEIAFLREMIRHHRTAVVKASQCVERAYHEQLQDMCSQIVSAQLAEIRQMEDWLCQWYGICRRRHTG